MQIVRTRLAGLKHIVYALITLLVLVVLGEVGLRIYDSYTGQVTRRDVFDQGLICKSWQTHHALKPLETWALEPSSNRAVVPVRTNSLGLRSDEIAVPKPPGTYRIICLGDERTLGAEVPLEQTFSHQLQLLLQPYTQQQVEVINAGVPGYCPLLSFLQVRHQLSGLQPDLFVLNFDMSDVADDYRYRRLTSMSAGSVPLSCTHPGLLPAPDTGSSKNCELLLLLQWGKRTATGLWADNLMSDQSGSIGTPQGQYAWLQDRPPDWSVYIGQALEPLGHLNRLARGLYADLLVASGPVPWQVSATASCAEGVREAVGVEPGTLCASKVPFEILAQYCNEKGLSFCDASEVFRSSELPDQLYLPTSLGFSAAGHELYARKLATCIVGNSAGIWERPKNMPVSSHDQRDAPVR